MGSLGIVQICQILIGLFLGICMFQSGTDKILDWKGNYKWLQGHFSNTFLKSFVKPMLLIVLILEIFSGVLCLVGSLFGLLNNDTSLILTGLILIGINLTALFFGQRYAKDYEGAAVLVNYFVLTIIGLLTFAL
tara:strand:+ start:213 stop:614 length:402 start_codon:yes stop_codon:yes gene_type:complete